jgi:hypothetical protein
MTIASGAIIRAWLYDGNQGAKIPPIRARNDERVIHDLDHPKRLLSELVRYERRYLW